MKIIFIQELLNQIIDENDVRLFSLIFLDRFIVLGRYFVYFFGPDFEYSWTDAHTLIPYSGLEEFIKHAEISVQNVCVNILYDFHIFSPFLRQHQNLNK